MLALTKRSAPTHAQTRAVGSVADSLANYLSREAPGAASNFAAMCERLARFTTQSAPCPECSGLGVREFSEDELEIRGAQLKATTTRDQVEQIVQASRCRRCDGSGYIESPGNCIACDGLGTRDGEPCGDCGGKGRLRRAAHEHGRVTVRCSRCRGCGEVPDEDLEDVCQQCSGETFEIPVTVYGKGSSKKGKLPPGTKSLVDGGYIEMPTVEMSPVANEDEVAEHGRMGRVVYALERQDPLLAAALKAYYGPDGDRWGPHKWGRIFVLWSLTEAGKRLVEDGAKRSLKGHTYLLSPTDMLTSERNAEETATTPNLRRRTWLREADRDARILLDRANRALQEAGS